MLVGEGNIYIMYSDYQGEEYAGEHPPLRKVLRLAGRDYSAPGFYFITICTLAHAQWLGDVVNNEICLSSAGIILQSVWQSLPGRFPGLVLDAFVVMPNHVHGIILLTRHLRYSNPGVMGRPTLSNIVSAYKGAATYLIRRSGGMPDFAWHKSYYDVIMRTNCALDRTRRYIANNPERWIADRFYGKGTQMMRE
jgi:putative transposase